MPPANAASLESSDSDSPDVGVLARVVNPVLWKPECLTKSCRLGNLAADALCEWAAGSGPVACIIPSRFLADGLKGGSHTFSDLAEVLPPHPLISVSLRVEGLRSVLAASQAEAWRMPCQIAKCPAWQVAGIHLSWSCTTSASRLELLLPNGSFVSPPDSMTVRVLTLAPALPLLGEASFAEQPQHLAVSAQHVLADYLRAHSPLQPAASNTPARLQPLGDCSKPSCPIDSPALAFGAAVLGIPQRHAAAAQGSLAGLSSAVLLVISLAAAGCLGAWLRKRRLAAKPLQHEPVIPAGPFPAAHVGVPPPSSVAVPPFSARGPPSGGVIRTPDHTAPSHDYDPEREPLRTGSVRLTDHKELGR